MVWWRVQVGHPTTHVGGVAMREILTAFIDMILLFAVTLIVVISVSEQESGGGISTSPASTEYVLMNVDVPLGGAPPSSADPFPICVVPRFRPASLLASAPSAPQRYTVFFAQPMTPPAKPGRLELRVASGSTIDWCTDSLPWKNRGTPHLKPAAVKPIKRAWIEIRVRVRPNKEPQ